MHQVINQAEKYSSDRNISVLIEGESGTGKELIARYIHYHGKGSGLRPFVALNCGAISQELFEGELFGHEPGAFTGATSKGQIGKIEAANGGTIFLDEIGTIPLNFQVKLLRVLEEKSLYRLGSTKEVPVDIRIICATNTLLKKAVAEKIFRLDLFYRINTGTIRIPPLREQPEAIFPLALHFVNLASARKGKKIGGFTPAAEKFLVSFPWPGNVRELKNAMERLVLLGPCDYVDVCDLAFIKDTAFETVATPDLKFILGHDDFDLPVDGLDLEDINRQILNLALKKNQGNQTRTAQYLGVSRRVLQGRLKKAKLI